MGFKSARFNSAGDLTDFVNGVLKVTAAVIPVAPPGGGGSGYAVDDLLTVIGGGGEGSAVLKVTGEAGGVITGVSIENEGAYLLAPSNPVFVSGGNGSGAFFDLTTGAAISGQSDITPLSILMKGGQWYVGYWS